MILFLRRFFYENLRKHREIKLVTTDKKDINWCQNLIITQQNGFQSVC